MRRLNEFFQIDEASLVLDLASHHHTLLCTYSDDITASISKGTISTKQGSDIQRKSILQLWQDAFQTKL